MAHPIFAYFAEYPNYPFWPSKKDWRQIGAFNGLAGDQEWDQTHRRPLEFSKLQETWQVFVEAEFSGNTLADYQRLCRELLINPIPYTIDDCKEKLSSVHVNIVDLVQFRVATDNGWPATPPTRFETSQELEEYTKKEKKKIPIWYARAEILKVLFRNIS
jgi:hypothetical protein